MKTSVYEKGEAKYIPYNSYGDSLVDRMTGKGEFPIWNIKSRYEISRLSSRQCIVSRMMMNPVHTLIFDVT